MLVMHEGSEQQFSSSGVLNYLKFSEYIFDLTPFMSAEEIIRYKPSDRYLHELLAPDPLDVSKRKDRIKLAAEANSRLAGPLYCFAFMAIALAAVIGGPFSRLGYGRRIVVAGATVALVRIVGFGIEAVCGANVGLNVLQYGIPLAPALAAMAMLLSPGFPWRALPFGAKTGVGRHQRLGGAI